MNPLSKISSDFFFTAPAPTEIYTLSLHDALPISPSPRHCHVPDEIEKLPDPFQRGHPSYYLSRASDRKSTRLNSSHPSISYAVFCLKKKKRLHRTGRIARQATQKLERNE